MEFFSFEYTVTAPSNDEFLIDLFDTGCRDADTSYSEGKVIVTFDREGASYDEVIKTSKEQIVAAGGTIISGPRKLQY